jgi:hypothetical protein
MHSSPSPFLLSSAHEPIAPLYPAKAVRLEDNAVDGRKERVYQMSCRVFRVPAFALQNWVD